ncbi:MAG: selenide, water dikinase SelD [Dehalococcoidia bacterium]
MTQPLTSTAPRLTELAAMAGCTGKAGAESLAFVLEHLGRLGGAAAPDELLVGLQQPDDAAVYRLADDRALVVTLDFFAPIVDDPYAYGAISAANALSDVYAMGADVALALNISAFPVDLAPEVVGEILRGGADKVAEAGGFIVGGHTIIDAEPKYGLCAIGFVHPDRVLTKGGATAGDALYLTKPLGTGLIATAAKFEEASPDHVDAAIESMSRLNRAPASIAREAGVDAMTDVTGFGILGHAFEVATASGVEVCLSASALPLLPGAEEYAYRGIISGGELRNREHLVEGVRCAPDVTEDMEHILFDPQTSGGLLLSVPPAHIEALEAGFAHADLPLWRIGEVRAGAGVFVAA